MDLNGIISNLSPQTISAFKQSQLGAVASVMVAKKALNAQN